MPNLTPDQQIELIKLITQNDRVALVWLQDRVMRLDLSAPGKWMVGDPLPHSVKVLLRHRERLKAIQLLRVKAGYGPIGSPNLGLGQAKQIVDDWCNIPGNIK
jgi:hypothetical protein